MMREWKDERMAVLLVGSNSSRSHTFPPMHKNKNATPTHAGNVSITSAVLNQSLCGAEYNGPLGRFCNSSGSDTRFP